MKKLTLIIFAISVVGCSGYSFRSWEALKAKDRIRSRTIGDSITIMGYLVHAELEYFHRSEAFLEAKKNASLRCEYEGKEIRSFKGYELQHISTINRTIEERTKEKYMDKKSNFLCIHKLGPPRNRFYRFGRTVGE